MPKPDYEQDELYILLECTRDESYMLRELFEEENNCEEVRQLLKESEAIEQYPITMVWFFHDDIRETNCVAICDPYIFLGKARELIETGWYPICSELTVNADGDDDWRFLGMRFFSGDPSLEDQAVVSSMFDVSLEDMQLVE